MPRGSLYEGGLDGDVTLLVVSVSLSYPIAHYVKAVGRDRGGRFRFCFRNNDFILLLLFVLKTNLICFQTLKPR